MSKVKDFFANLKKSTKITLVSCGCFIAMTALILCFFIMFPITPSEKVIASFGRESVLKKDSTSPAGSTVTTMNGVEVSKGSSNKLSTVTTKRVTRRNNFSMDVTTGSGFFSGGNILTGNYDPYYTWTPTATTPNTGYSGYEGGNGNGNGGTGTGYEGGTGTGYEGGTGTGYEGGTGTGYESGTGTGTGGDTGTGTGTGGDTGTGTGTGGDTGTGTGTGGDTGTGTGTGGDTGTGTGTGGDTGAGTGGDTGAGTGGDTGAGTGGDAGAGAGGDAGAGGGTAE